MSVRWWIFIAGLLAVKINDGAYQRVMLIGGESSGKCLAMMTVVTVPVPVPVAMVTVMVVTVAVATVTEMMVMVMVTVAMVTEMMPMMNATNAG